MDATCWCGEPATFWNEATDATNAHPACLDHVKDGWTPIEDAPIRAYDWRDGLIWEGCSRCERDERLCEDHAAQVEHLMEEGNRQLRERQVASC